MDDPFTRVQMAPAARRQRQAARRQAAGSRRQRTAAAFILPSAALFGDAQPYLASGMTYLVHLFQGPFSLTVPRNDKANTAE